MTKASNITKHPGLSIDLSDALRKKFEEESQPGTFEEWLNENCVGDEPTTVFALELQENDEGEICIKIPDELIAMLGWELDDDIVFEETDDEGGFTLQNVSKQFRDGLEQ